MKYAECPHCGAHLDHGEACDCQKPVTVSDYVRRKLGNVGDATIEAALPSAQEKLKRIIKREGDANGERLKAYYIAQLVVEAIEQSAMERFMDGRRTV